MSHPIAFIVETAAPLLPIAGILWMLLAIAIHVILAYFVYVDACTLRAPALGIPPVVWFLGVLVGSFVGVLGYWIMNRSTLAPPAK